MDDLERKVQKDYAKLTVGDQSILSYVREFPRPEQIVTSDGLPFKFVPGSDNFFDDQQYYHDSWPILRALAYMGPEGHQTMLGMVENFFFELDRDGLIPNSQQWKSRSQPPFLSSMVLLVYDTFVNNGYWDQQQAKTWLKKAYGYVKLEYDDVWAGPSSLGLLPEYGLSKYFDRQNGELYGSGKPYYGPQQASGWDNSTRFDGVAHQLIPIDLNSLLYKYEQNLAKMAGILNNPKDQEMWTVRSSERRQAMLELMWNGKGFSDYNFKTGRQANKDTLAGYFALMAGLLDPVNDETKITKMVGEIPGFEFDFGLATTAASMAGKGYQWAYPNVWPILNLVVIDGHREIGRHDIADRITYKLLTGLAHLSKHPSMGQFPEAISANDGTPRVADPRYHHQTNTYMTMGAAGALFHDIERRYEAVNGLSPGTVSQQKPKGRSQLQMVA